MYNMILVCRIGEAPALANALKMVCASILQEDGVVRGITNLGDRVLNKTLKSGEGL